MSPPLLCGWGCMYTLWCSCDMQIIQGVLTVWGAGELFFGYMWVDSSWAPPLLSLPEIQRITGWRGRWSGGCCSYLPSEQVGSGKGKFSSIGHLWGSTGSPACAAPGTRKISTCYCESSRGAWWWSGVRAKNTGGYAETSGFVHPEEGKVIWTPKGRVRRLFLRDRLFLKMHSNQKKIIK